MNPREPSVNPCVMARVHPLSVLSQQLSYSVNPVNPEYLKKTYKQPAAAHSPLGTSCRCRIHNIGDLGSQGSQGSQIDPVASQPGDRAGHASRWVLPPAALPRGPLTAKKDALQKFSDMEGRVNASYAIA